MTKKEALRIDNLIAENIGLQDEINKHMRVYGELLSEVVCLRSRIETISEIISWPIGHEYEQ